MLNEADTVLASYILLLKKCWIPEFKKVGLFRPMPPGLGLRLG
jgi:hypothetical protein